MNEKSYAQISARFKEERKRLDLSQQEMASVGGVSLRTLQGWESGNFPPKTEFLAHAADAGVDISYVVTGHRLGTHLSSESTQKTQLVADFSHSKSRLKGAAPAPVADTDTLYIPLLSATGSMGPGSEAVAADVVMGDVPVSLTWVQMTLPRSRPEALRLVHAYGDSMRGTLESGDFALVDTDIHSVDIDGVYVLEAHERLFIKRVRQRMDGRYEISSDNPAIKQTDILNGGHEVRICGMVVYGWNGRRF